MLTHGLHYASAVFEGMRAYDGEIFKLSEHNQRLHKSAKILDFEIPYSVAELDKAARDVVRANKLTDAYVRPIAWRGSEQMGVARAGDQDQSRHRRLGLGLLFRSRRAPRVSGSISPSSAGPIRAPRRPRARRPGST